MTRNAENSLEPFDDDGACSEDCRLQIGLERASIAGQSVFDRTTQEGDFVSCQFL